MALWLPNWLLSLLPAWLPLESVCLVAVALAIYLTQFLVWLGLRWHSRREWKTGRAEYERRVKVEHERRALHAYRERVAEEKSWQGQEVVVHQELHQRIPRRSSATKPIQHLLSSTVGPFQRATGAPTQPPADYWRQAYKHAFTLYHRERLQQRIADEEFRPWYADYLQDDIWKERHLLIQQRNHGICQMCSAIQTQKMHLLTYACAGNKDPDHLISVCYSCYQAEHTPPPHPLYA